MSQISPHFPGTVFIVAASLFLGKEVNKEQGLSVVTT
jgi:hypothetical protein